MAQGQFTAADVDQPKQMGQFSAADVDTQPANAQPLPDKSPGFWGEAGHLIGDQAESLLGGPYKAYKAYTEARSQGQPVSVSLAAAAPHILPGAQEMQTALDAVGNYENRRQQGYGPIYSALAPFVAPSVGIDLHRMEDAAGTGHGGLWNPEVLANAAVPAAETVAGAGLSEIKASVGGALDKAADLLRNPATAKQSQMGKPGTPKSVLPPALQRWVVPDWMIPKGEKGSPTNPGWFADLPSKMPKMSEPEAELGSAANPGWVAPLPNTMPKPPAPAAPELGSPQNPGWVAPLPNRMPRISTSAMPSPVPGLPPIPGVSLIPEPRAAGPTDNPGYMASIPRSKLQQLAAKGTPGAGAQLQNLGRSVIYAPSGAGIESPAVTPLRSLLLDLIENSRKQRAAAD